MPTLYLYGPEDFEQGLPDEKGGAAEGSRGWTLTLKADAEPTVIEIEDDDLVFDEVDYSQVLADDVTIGDTDYPAGTTAHSSYDLTNAESGHKITGVHLGGNGYQQGAVQGVVSTVDMEPGETYCFDRERTSHRQDNEYEDYAACFAAGTRIATQNGLTPVERLQPGDWLMTATGSACLRLVLTRRLKSGDLRRWPNMRPVRITCGALGAGLPRRDLVVSPQHRMLTRSRIAARMFGDANVLVAAHRLTGLPGIAIDHDMTEVCYHHLVLDSHQIIYAEGAPTESFYCGPVGLLGLPVALRNELYRLFPDLGKIPPKSARLIPPNRQQRALLARHAEHDRALIC